MLTNHSQNGQKLFFTLLKLNRFSLRKSSDIELPEYKYFTVLSNEIIALHKRYGVDILPIIINFRQRLKDDLEMEKKLSDLKKSAFLEIMIVMFFTWSFVFIAKLSVEIKFNSNYLSLIFIWQLLGMIVLHYGLRLKKKLLFTELSQFIKSIFTFEALYLAPISLSKLIATCSYQELLSLKKYMDIREHFEVLLNQLKVYGELRQEDVSELSQCVVYQYNHNCTLFEKFSKGLKLTVLMVFFMSSFLMINFTLMYSMMQS